MSQSVYRPRQHRLGRRGRLRSIVTVTMTIAVPVATVCAGAGPAFSGNADGAALMTQGSGLTYGYDFSHLGPDYYSWNNRAAVTSARNVMASVPGTFDDQGIMGFGPPNPEPSPGVYHFSGIAERIHIIEATGGTPVLTLAGAPDWMKGGRPGTTNWRNIGVPPTPEHYEDFAQLCAKIALAFPQVKYFVVWKELQGFFDQALNRWDYENYTNLYNDVYAAIKQVRPDAMIGGPYVFMASSSTPQSSVGIAPSGPWGYLDERSLDVIAYWLEHNMGADFVAVDGPTFTKDQGLITDPVTSAEKYAAVDKWISAHTNLPIWWMESSVQPTKSGWSSDQAAAVRIATLAELDASGASVAMQWQPESGAGTPNEGLWSGPLVAGGGRATPLGAVLPSVLPIFKYPIAIVSGEPSGVLVATNAIGTVAVNTSNIQVSAMEPSRWGTSSQLQMLKPGGIVVSQSFEQMLNPVGIVVGKGYNLRVTP